MGTVLKYHVPGKIQASHDAVKMVLDQYEYSRNEVVDPKREQFEEFYAGYRSSMEVPEDDLITRLSIPLIYSNVEDFIARLSVAPKIEVWGRGGPQDLSRANSHRSLLEYDWQVLNMMLKIVRIAKSAEVYGTCFVKTTHRKDVQRRLIRQTQTEQRSLFGIPLGRSRQNTLDWKETTVWDDPWVEICEITSIYPDPDGRTFDPTDPHKCEWGIHETPITLEALKGARQDGDPLYTQSVVGELEELSKRANMKESARHGNRIARFQ